MALRARAGADSRARARACRPRLGHVGGVILREQQTGAADATAMVRVVRLTKNVQLEAKVLPSAAGDRVGIAAQGRTRCAPAPAIWAAYR